MDWRKFLWRATLAALPVAIFGAYQRAPTMAILPWYVLLPWVWLYLDDRERPSWLWWFLSAFFIWRALHPAASDYGHAGWLGGILFWAAMYPILPAMAAIRRRTKWPRAFVVPLVWTAGEWFRARYTLSHFDIYQLGYTQARFLPIVQVADLFGSYGVTFLVAMWSGWLADLGFAWRDRGWAAAWRDRSIRVWGAVFACLIAGTIGYGFWKIRSTPLVDGPRLAVIQPSIRHTMNNAYGVHLSQWAMTEDALEPGEADMIVWPENAIMDYLDRKGIYLDDLEVMLGRLDMPLLLGAFGEGTEPGRTRNSAFLLDRDGNVLERYDKRVLYPWSEYIPLDAVLERWWPGLRRLQRFGTRIAWGFVPVGSAGDRAVLFEHLGVPFAVLICVENTYAPVVSETGRLGARFLVNITSEGEVGGPVQEQLLRVCILRAIENRVAYVRAGNTGISGFIDPLGSVHSVLEGERGGKIGVQGHLIDRVRLGPRQVTWHARSRDAFAKACVAFTAALLLFAAVPRRFRRAGAAASIALVALSILSGCGVPEPARTAKDAAGSLARLQAMVPAEAVGEGWVRELEDACADLETCREALTPAGALFRRTRRFEIGAEFFARVARRHESLSQDAHAFRGWLLGQAGQHVAALRAFEDARIRDAPPRYRAWFGHLLSDVRDWPRALRVFERIWRERPEDLDSAFLYARALYLTDGDSGTVRVVVEDVLRRDEGHARARTLLGRIEADAGRVDAALEHWHRSAADDPGHLEGRYLIARTAMARGDREEADRWIAEIRAIEDTLGKAPVLEEGG